MTYRDEASAELAFGHIVGATVAATAYLIQMAAVIAVWWWFLSQPLNGGR